MATDDTDETDLQGFFDLDKDGEKSIRSFRRNARELVGHKADI